VQNLIDEQVVVLLAVWSGDSFKKAIQLAGVELEVDGWLIGQPLGPNVLEIRTQLQNLVFEGFDVFAQELLDAVRN
jgi:hypothetical protein